MTDEYTHQVLHGLHTNSWPPRVLDTKHYKFKGKEGDTVVYDGRKYRVTAVNTQLTHIKHGIAHYGQNVWVDIPNDTTVK